ncbi:cytochrome c oxidase subunit II [Hydrocarboniclastica marina]|uniref:Cytochrome c oxidase subunit 2 n=1 Tax=Hydrocarboniclastica marina TaxID=2259620 RepID=A0A4P7XEJ8_9ALTE|nr:cytochrome c oxidase subunit II [Hydrocarboniclastica marina]MAM00492.1 cytochrome c oxidase subunit II [Alteromonadaceae bacterium]QCF24512.1 cytochrome c oxidase subunit II [Hydrocarboniclastica marina]
MSVQALRAGALAVAGLMPVGAMADWEVNMTPGVTDLSQSIYGLHMIIFFICVAIGVVVFGVMFWSIFAHRKSRGAKAANFHESTSVEIAWTVIPVIILVAMAIPATGTLVEMYDSTEADIDIKVTGYQWRWQYEYMDDDFSFFSNTTTSQDAINNRVSKGENYLLEVDNTVKVPVGKKVRFLVTANDVIHSWWVPALGVKKDAIPGFINETWATINEPGIYRGQCTELCGRLHAFMPIVVEAVPEEEYLAWVAEKREEAAAERELTEKEWTMAELMERGERVYNSNCVSCHQADGSGVPPAFPALVGSDVALGDISRHMDVVVNGVPGTAMQAFGNQLSEVDLAAVITYERNAWGNDVGDMATPQDIVEFEQAE